MNQDISILFENWTSVETPPLVGRCMVAGQVDGWVGSSQIIQNQINLDFFLDIFQTFLLKPLQPFTGLFFEDVFCLQFWFTDLLATQ